MADTVYAITPLHVGTCRLGEDHVLGDDCNADDRMEFALIAFLVRGGDRRVLVDLGPKTLDYSNRMFHRFGFFRTLDDGSAPDDIVQPEGNVFDGLRRAGVSAEEITDVVFTHLHADHHGMDDARDAGACEDFRNAAFHISRTGWDYNVAKRVDGHWNSYLDWGFGDFLLRAEQEGRLTAVDNDHIAPGLRTIYLGGHSPCSQGVVVNTAAGEVVIGADDFYRYNLLENGVLARIYTTRERLLRTNGMLADMALEGKAIIPVHDPVIVQLYRDHGEDWLSAARELSLKAGRGFRTHHPA